MPPSLRLLITASLALSIFTIVSYLRVPQSGITITPSQLTAQVTGGSTYHPADTGNTGSDWVIQAPEVSSILYCYRNNNCGGSVIQPQYVSTAASLYRTNAGAYHYDSTQTCPGCWVTGVGATSSTMYTVSTQINPAGAGTATGTGSYALNTPVTVSATPYSCYTFNNWTENGAFVGSTTSYGFTVSSNRILQANFNQKSVTSSASVYPVGAGTVTAATTTPCGAQITFAATAATNYQFKNWTTTSGFELSTSASYTFNALSTRTIVANFTYMATSSYLITVISGSGGTALGGGVFAPGASVTVTAKAAPYNTSPEYSFMFNNWTENDIVVSSSSAYTFLANSNRILKANFVPTRVSFIRRVDRITPVRTDLHNVKKGEIKVLAINLDNSASASQISSNFAKLSTYISNSSSGTSYLKTDVIGPVSGAHSADACNHIGWADDARDAGYPVDSYDYVAYVGKCVGVFPDYWMHETLHGFGLEHSNFGSYGSDGLTTVTGSEYGDLSDIMGANDSAYTQYLSALQRDMLGWLNVGTDTLDNPSGGTYSLLNKNDASQGLKFIRMPRAHLKTYNLDIFAKKLFLSERHIFYDYFQLEVTPGYSTPSITVRSAESPRMSIANKFPAGDISHPSNRVQSLSPSASYTDSYNGNVYTFVSGNSSQGQLRIVRPNQFKYKTTLICGSGGSVPDVLLQTDTEYAPTYTEACNVCYQGDVTKQAQYCTL